MDKNTIQQITSNVAFNEAQLNSLLQIFLNFLTSVQYSPPEQYKKLANIFFKKMATVLKYDENWQRGDNVIENIKAVMTEISSEKMNYINQRLVYARIVFDVCLRQASNPYARSFDPRSNIIALKSDGLQKKISKKEKKEHEALIQTLQPIIDRGVMSEKLMLVYFLAFVFLILLIQYNIESSSIPAYIYTLNNILSFLILSFTFLLHRSMKEALPNRGLPEKIGSSLTIEMLNKNHRQLLATLSNLKMITEKKVFLSGKNIQWINPRNQEKINYEYGSLSTSVIPIEMSIPIGIICYVFWDWQELVERKIITGDPKDHSRFILGFNHSVQILPFEPGYYWQKNVLCFRFCPRSNPIFFTEVSISSCGGHRLYFPKKSM